ncbi:ATP-binding protein [Nannocystis bainbridge]|uniref:ATP-binding protein n=1 Tax=Nannocystis bainbridge TaxID=2995303 RepID=A0ABT5E7J7_9BACT|nr:RNA-binding domain-containing protein [Nannocystis bainbridge]MDC0721635.1 ATP-binding protein [Nannocystis bainbridge]
MPTPGRSSSYLQGLVRELCKLPGETPWVEFKVDNAEPQEIGEYISALANGAALASKTRGYLVWGIKDDDHAIVGTQFDPNKARKGNEALESWLLRLLEPRIEFSFSTVELDGKRVVLLEIVAASGRPVSFSGREYIRVGSYKKPLGDFPEKERELWRLFDRVPFEKGIAAPHLSEDEVLQMLDYPSYFDLLELPLPDGRSAILDALRRDQLVVANAETWDITNLGAILFAKRISDFASLSRKAVRVIQYRGRDRTETVREQLDGRGYASGFEGLLVYLNGILPTTEVVGQALRHQVPRFPELAVRELVANALIHQDFSVTGAGPMVEVFDGRVEITDPGEPLVAVERLLDSPPFSRNETLASLMRRFRICEERGSGIDKVVAQVELHQLPPPLFETPPGFTRVVLFAPRDFNQMDKEERVRACYWHACLKYVQREPVTNSTIRERFGISEPNRAMASRLLRDAVEAGVIVPRDAAAAPKLMQYLPWWATSSARGST